MPTLFCTNNFFNFIKIVHPVGDFLFELPMITARGNTSLVLLWLWFCYFQHLMCHSWMIWMSWRCIWTLRVIHSQAVKSLHTVLRQLCFTVMLWIMGAYKKNNALTSIIKSCLQLGCCYIKRKRTQKSHCFPIRKLKVLYILTGIKENICFPLRFHSLWMYP